MKKILIYDIAAEYGGAVSILNYYYQLHKQDKSNQYVYILSSYHLSNTDNIQVINIPVVKKSWFHRLWFDFVGVKKYLKQYDFDECISLQNTVVPCFKKKQTLYCHNALPYAEYRYSIIENKKLWLYQNIIGKLFNISARRADSIIVQTEWMKKALIKCGVYGDKISVQFPVVEIPQGYMYRKQKTVHFLYPANGADFKNHKVIVDACSELLSRGIYDFSVTFTLNGNESRSVAELFERTRKENIPINWIGMIERASLFDYYTKSVLVFPSFIETVGLPLYEASKVGCPILVADCAYSRDVVGSYDKIKFFNYNDAKRLADYMVQEINSRQ